MHKEQLLEQLAELEHQQWMNWAQHLIQTENLSQATITRWQSFFIPYDQLSESIKEQDRDYARKVMDVVKKHLDCR